MKKLLLKFVYFACVIGFIILFADYVGMTESQAFLIFISSVLLYFLFIVISKLRYIKIRKRPKRKHTNRKFIIIIPLLIISCLFLYNHNKKVEIPEALVAFGEKYPEALSFVNDYPKNYNKHHRINIKNEVKKGEIPLFIQWDERWGYENYGSNFLAVNGCGPTCLSMVYCGLTGDTSLNPLKMADFSDSKGYYISGQGTSWSLMTEGAKALGLNVKAGTVSEKYIKENLTKSTPIICSVRKGDFTYSGHFIVLTGIDSDGNIILNDPNSKINSEKHWSIQRLLPQIKSLWVYSV